MLFDSTIQMSCSINVMYSCKMNSATTNILLIIKDLQHE